MDLTVRDVARLLRVPEDDIRDWITSGRLPACDVGGQFRLSREAVLEWATANGVRVPAELFATPTPQRTPTPSVIDALTVGGIFRGLPGRDKSAVLGSLVDRLRLPPTVNREFLHGILLAREALGSTGIGNGIAIPHPRNPIVLHVDSPTISLAFLEKPIDFGAMDGQPVHTLFALITPTVHVHLLLLSRLAYLLHDPEFASRLKPESGDEDILLTGRRVEAHLRLPV